MAQVIRHSPFKGARRHRADEIGVHERRWWASAWIPLALLGVLAVVVLAFLALGPRSRMSSAPAIGTSTEPQTPLAVTPGMGMAPGVGAACASSTIYFERDLSVLGKDDYSAIRTVAECLKRNPSETVRLEGRADPRETLAGYNTLAQSRADAVADELMGLGVSSSQIKTSASVATCSESDDACFDQDRSVTTVFGP